MNDRNRSTPWHRWAVDAEPRRHHAARRL